jgi:hypothetical protein
LPSANITKLAVPSSNKSGQLKQSLAQLLAANTEHPSSSQIAPELLSETLEFLLQFCQQLKQQYITYIHNLYTQAEARYVPTADGNIM